MKNLDDFERDETDAYLWRAGLLNVKEKGMDYMLHYEQVFGNVFESRESKGRGALMKHCRKVKYEKWSLSIWLSNQKTKILMLYQDNYFAVSVKLNFC